MRLAKDSEHRVRQTLAEAAAQTDLRRSETARALLELFARDPRHRVRVAADIRSPE